MRLFHTEHQSSASAVKNVEKNHKQARRVLSEPYVDGPATEIDVVIAIFFSYCEGIQLHFSRRSWWEAGWMVQ